jgi:hypothetical protein
MRAVVGFARFWYDFVVGDDWTVAAGVVVALALTAVLAHAHLPAWWLLPVAVLGFFALSLARAARTVRRAQATRREP